MKSKLLFIPFIFLFISCTSVEVQSLNNMRDTMFPEYEAYVDADPNLTEAGKKVRKLRLETLRKLIDELNK